MDTVSIIRGNIGRPAMKEEDRIYFMKKKFTLSEGGKANTSNPIPFEFIMEATEKNENLVDAYVGVEFSIIVIHLIFKIYSMRYQLFLTREVNNLKALTNSIVQSQ